MFDEEFASSGLKTEISGFESHFEPGGCKAGNKMCSSLSEAPVPSPLEAMFCDICCSEPRFCRVLLYSLL